MGTHALGTAVIAVSALFGLPAVLCYLSAARSMAKSPSK